MNREQYIEKLMAIYKLKYKPSELEIEEFRLMLEMMPDAPILKVGPSSPLCPRDINDKPFPEQPVVVMYGVQTPQQWFDGNKFVTTSTKTEDK